MKRIDNQAKKRRKKNIKEKKREQNESLCLSGWAEGLQSLAGVLLLTAAAAQFYILRWCLDSAPAFLSPALMFSIRGDHKLLSAVITAVHCGPAEGSQPVLVHQVTLDHGTSVMGSRKDLQAG